MKSRVLRERLFRLDSRRWFVSAPPIASTKQHRVALNPSNPDRRLVCRYCTPERRLHSMNFYAVYCPRCHSPALEEMTRAEVEKCLDEIPITSSHSALSRIRRR